MLQVNSMDRPKYLRRGVCGHFMQDWDPHLRCQGCRARGKGQDPCVLGYSCEG